jgi:hypothetical protein
MQFVLEIKEEAVADVQDAFLYYEEQKLGLGNRFLDTLEIYFNRIQNYPEHYQIKRKPYREAFIKDFPYIIIFELEGHRIIVYAVFNTWKNPNKKPKKIK